ncbi:MFS transporter [Peribacillus sp. SCS-26]|uniref:MFS transporter n=1 Tax=Paraperibacillus marinus TaxID=3115295 RepID=UPI003906D243
MKKSAFYQYLITNTCSSLGDVVYIMVFTTTLYQQTGSAFMASLLPLLRGAAGLVAGFTAPLLLQKWKFTSLLLCLPVMKTILLTAMIIGFMPLTDRMYFLVICISMLALLEGWTSPLLSSVLPRAVDSSQLVKANSLLSTAGQAVQIAGYTFTGYAVVTLGELPVLIAAGGFYWISLLCLFFLINGLSKDETPVEKKPGLAALKEGWAILWNNRTLRLVTIMDCMEGIAGTIWVGAITLVYVKEALNSGEQWWGYINASYYAGAILGGAVTWLFASRIQRHLVASMAIGSLLFSIFTLLYGLNSSPAAALILCAAMGPAYQLRDTAQQTALQTGIELNALPQAYASRNILLSAISSLSIALAGLTADMLGIRMVYILGGILIASSAALSFILLRYQKERLGKGVNFTG